MTKEQKIRTEICFADKGSGSYLYCSLWDMMDEHEVTMEDFHHQTKAWREAVVASLCETYEYASYEEVWSLILCSAFVERDSERDIAKETAENIKAYLISEAINGTLDLDFNNLDFSHLIVGDEEIFNSEGRIEQGCGKEDCCRT